MKFKHLSEEQQKLGRKLHKMCRHVGYDFEDFVQIEDIIGLRSEGNLFTVYLTKSGVYSIERGCPTCGFSERVESSAGMSDKEIRAWLKRELDKSDLINDGSLEMEHTCGKV